MLGECPAFGVEDYVGLGGEVLEALALRLFELDAYSGGGVSGAEGLDALEGCGRDSALEEVR